MKAILASAALITVVALSIEPAAAQSNDTARERAYNKCRDQIIQMGGTGRGGRQQQGAIEGCVRKAQGRRKVS